jgi:xylose isomerase
MKRKYSIITGFMGAVKDRFIDYQPARTMEEMVKMASQVPLCSGLEVVYPQNFTDPVVLKKQLEEVGLGVSTVNLNVKGEKIFRFGSFSSPNPQARKAAVDMLGTAMDAAAELGCGMVTVAPLNDGADYPFELDYIRAYNHAVETVREGASHRGDVKVSVEYKLSEPRMHCLIGNAGKAAAFCEKIALPNVGVTLDVGHALQSGEIPADSLSFLHSMNRLFYIHINDNFRNWDWDMLPGTVNLWDYVEFALYMKRVGYDGWITADVFPQRHDPVKVMQKTFEWMDFIFELADRLDEKKLYSMMDTNDGLDILEYVRGQIFGGK